MTPPTVARLTVLERLTLVVLATLPFTQALTVDLRFPLKIYEVALIGAGIVWLARSPERRALRWRLDRTETIALAIFTVAAFVSLHVSVLLSEQPASRGIHRFSPYLDGLLSVGYLALSLVTLTLVVHLARRHLGLALRCWFAGALLASAYSLYLAFASIFGLVVPQLPGAAAQVIYIGSVPLVRSGTFLEGNFLGLYLLISLVLALVAVRPLVAFVVSVAALTTLSTVTFLGLLIAWTVAVVAHMVTGRSLLRVLMPAVGLATVLALLPTAYYEAAVGNKLAALLLERGQPNTPATAAETPATAPPPRSEVEEQIASDNRTRSSSERLALVAASAQMALDRPITGVGAAQYGLWWPQYRPEWLADGFLDDPKQRYIPNNVYAQVLAEHGTVAFVALGVVLLSFLRRALRTRNAVLITGFILLLLSFNAYPTYVIAFIWAFLGVVVGISREGAASANRAVDDAPDAGQCLIPAPMAP